MNGIARFLGGTEWRAQSVAMKDWSYADVRECVERFDASDELQNDRARSSAEALM
jgi:hypothetical protein